MSNTIRTIAGGCSVLAIIAGTFSIPTAQARISRRTVTNETGETDFGSFRRDSSLQRKIDALDDTPVLTLRIPVLLGVKVGDFSDTWGDARADGRTHEGTDILAPRNDLIVSPTDAVVTSIGVGANGGNYVYTANPGRERYYFAHLDHYADGLAVGDVLEPGDLIGYVGNTGNASGGPTHLHFGIYTNSGAVNPFPRLTEAFSTSERMDAVAKALSNATSTVALAADLVTQYSSTFLSAQVEGVKMPTAIQAALVVRSAVIAAASARNLTLGSRGTDVTSLQQFLIIANKGSAAQFLADAGATGYFGLLTRAALAEYQAAVGISPAAGYFGPITRAQILNAGTIVPLQ